MMDFMSPAGRLLGRELALAAAGSVLGDALSGSGQFLMISGEAGIGKTAMLAALIDRAGPVPLVLRGFCWEGDGRRRTGRGHRSCGPAACRRPN